MSRDYAPEKIRTFCYYYYYLQSICFDEKKLCKYSFLYFSVKKKSHMKTIFTQYKKYDLFLEVVFHNFIF